MWIGWFKNDDFAEWEEVATGATLDDCSRQLIDKTRRRCGPASRRFMTRGTYPEDFFRNLHRQPPLAPADTSSMVETAKPPARMRLSLELAL